MLKAAVIGLGPIGNRHADNYHHLELTELVGVCDLLPDRADAASARLGVPRFTAAQQMLAAVRPDLVSVCTGGYEYASDHCAPTLEALEAGCHVLCEKPLSNEVADCERMVAKAREKGLCLGTNFNHRFTPAALQAKAWVDEGRLGHLLFANVALWIGNPAESSPYFHLKALHPHSVDMLRYYVGDIEAVQCFATKAPGRSIWSTAHMNLRFANGAVGGLTGSYDVVRAHPMERVEVAGTGGRLVVEDMWREATLYPAETLVKTVYTNPVFGGVSGFEDTFTNRIRRFAEQVAEGVSPEQIDGSGADGLAAQRVIAAFIDSLETERVVRVQPAN